MEYVALGRFSSVDLVDSMLSSRLLHSLSEVLWVEIEARCSVWYGKAAGSWGWSSWFDLLGAWKWVNRCVIFLSIVVGLDGHSVSRAS